MSNRMSLTYGSILEGCPLWLGIFPVEISGANVESPDTTVRAWTLFRPCVDIILVKQDGNCLAPRPPQRMVACLWHHRAWPISTYWIYVGGYYDRLYNGVCNVCLTPPRPIRPPAYFSEVLLSRLNLENMRLVPLCLTLEILMGVDERGHQRPIWYRTGRWWPVWQIDIIGDFCSST